MPSKAKRIDRTVSKLPSIPKELVSQFLTGPMAMLSNFGPGVLANFGPPPVPQPTVSLMDQGAFCGLESQSGFVRAASS